MPVFAQNACEALLPPLVFLAPWAKADMAKVGPVPTEKVPGSQGIRSGNKERGNGILLATTGANHSSSNCKLGLQVTMPLQAFAEALIQSITENRPATSAGGCQIIQNQPTVNPPCFDKSCYRSVQRQELSHE